MDANIGKRADVAANRSMPNLSNHVQERSAFMGVVAEERSTAHADQP